MVSAASAYFAIFTLTNIFINVYLHKSAEIYRETQKLPKWASDVRTFIEAADGTIKPYEINEIIEFYSGGKSAAQKLAEEQEEKLFNENIFGTGSSLKFLQLKTTTDNKYDIRDDFEYRNSFKNPMSEAEIKLNEHRANNRDVKSNNLDDFVKDTTMDEPDRKIDPEDSEIKSDDDEDIRNFKTKYRKNFEKIQEVSSSLDPDHDLSEIAQNHG